MVRAAERLNIPPKKWLRSRFCLFFFLAMPCGLKCPGGSDGKEFAFNSGVLGSIPGLGRSPRGQPGNPLQYSCLESPRGQRSLQRVGHDRETKHRAHGPRNGATAFRQEACTTESKLHLSPDKDRSPHFSKYQFNSEINKAWGKEDMGANCLDFNQSSSQI